MGMFPSSDQIMDLSVGFSPLDFGVKRRPRCIKSVSGVPHLRIQRRFATQTGRAVRREWSLSAVSIHAGGARRGR
eukprot:6246092-Pyramimonas_sp.AAC.1